MEPILDKMARHVRASNFSLFSLAAWYCLVAPFAAAGFSMPTYIKYSGYEHWQQQSFPTRNDALQILLLVCLSSFVLGIVSLFGIRRHGRSVILWKALAGILASCFFGLFAFVVLLADIGRQ